MPKLSVIMPVHNAARYLREAIASIQAQTLRDYEFIVVDDGSTDRSLQLLQDAAKADDRFRIFSRPNTGIVGALNDGLDRATGDFIARMDADDLAQPTRFEAQAAFLQSNPKVIALGSAVLFTDPEGRPLKPFRPPQHHREIQDQLAAGNGGAMIHPAVMFRRDALLASGRYRPQYNFVEDLDLYVRLLPHGTLANLDDILLHYRQHSKSVNRVVGDRSRQIREIIAPLRATLGLPALTLADALPVEAAGSDEAALRRQWAFYACEGGHPVSARKNALKAVLLRPAQKANWSCLRYVFRVANKF